MAFAKVGLYGPAGSGKTYTSALIAIGAIQKYKLAPKVAFFDTEPAASFVAPLFKKEKIQFDVADNSRALSDLMTVLKEAENGGYSFLIIDSITHVWRDLQKSYLKKLNEGRKSKNLKPIQKLEFHHWGPIKDLFGEFTDRYLSSRLHIIVCGRVGNIYEYQKNEENGKMELITTGNRMSSEKEMGYEPSLLVEMIKEVDGKGIRNVAFVEKDRSDNINGKSFPKPTFKNFIPHFEFLNLGGDHFQNMGQRDSSHLFTEEGDSNWGHEKRQREIWCEEIQSLMLKIYPSTSAKDKMGKSELLQQYFDTGSWTKVENMSADKLKDIFLKMKKELLKNEGPPAMPSELKKEEVADVPF